MFSLSIIKLVQTFPSTRIYWTFTDQLLRSATSVGANLAEAKSSSSKRDFMRYYEIALKSSNEARYWLCLLRDSKLIAREVVIPHITECQELSRMIASSLLTMKKKKI